MRDIHPNAILIDQFESIKVVVKEVRPNIIHEFCLWHILCKLPENFKYFCDFDKIITEFKPIVYDSLTIQIFETKWNEFVRKHILEANQWLLKLYSKSQSWAPVYLNHIFWINMVSTQKSEGMHAYFDVYFRSTMK